MSRAPVRRLSDVRRTSDVSRTSVGRRSDVRRTSDRHPLDVRRTSVESFSPMLVVIFIKDLKKIFSHRQKLVVSFLFIFFRFFPRREVKESTKMKTLSFLLYSLHLRNQWSLKKSVGCRSKNGYPYQKQFENSLPDQRLEQRTPVNPAHT